MFTIETEIVKYYSIVPNAATMGDKAYSPNPIEVKVGDGVTWSNDDSTIHTATSGSVGSADSGSIFDSGILSPGATFDFVFDNTGTYDYYCTLHPRWSELSLFLTSHVFSSCMLVMGIIL